MIDIQALAILREVSGSGSMTKAADKLCLTQSAVSHAIRRFEERHSVKLWEREGHKLRLTPAGRYLLELAHRVLPQLEHGAVVVEDYAKGKRGSIRMGMECHPCQAWLMRVLDRFLVDWPEIDIDITTAFQFGGLSALLSYEIDILITPDPIERPGLEYKPVFPYMMVLAVAESHILAKKTRIEPQDLTDQTLITYPVSKERLDIYTNFLVPGQARPKRHRTVETTELMLRLVAHGGAVSAIPDWLLQNVSGVKGIQLGDGIPKSIHLGFRQENVPEYINGFIALAEEVEI